MFGKSRKIARQVKELEVWAKGEPNEKDRRKLTLFDAVWMLCCLAAALASHIWLRPPHFDNGRTARLLHMEPGSFPNSQVLARRR
jgi:hypothetical protein